MHSFMYNSIKHFSQSVGDPAKILFIEPKIPSSTPDSVYWILLHSCISIFYYYFHAKCSSQFADRTSPILSRPHCTTFYLTSFFLNSLCKSTNVSISLLLLVNSRTAFLYLYFLLSMNYWSALELYFLFSMTFNILQKESITMPLTPNFVTFWLVLLVFPENLANKTLQDANLIMGSFCYVYNTTAYNLCCKWDI